ncbi:alpha/beta hydrolase [Bremerella cremea]|uniref:Alpha/beta hydrolase n=2 Tax=Bremerella cremea TaxID=1031537 RepID=A0A368KMV3_9BACT|nr:alpha/beta hydrolase [Bremerella cremea]
MVPLDELLLFFPAKFPEGDWQPEGETFEDVTFQAEDGTQLHGWYCPCEEPRGVLLLAHGNAGNIATRVDWIRYLQRKARLSVFAFDYRGYGKSEGKPSVKGVLQDATAARAKLCELAKVNDSDVILMGESLGGAVATALAAQAKPRALILQSTFPSLREVAAVHYPRLAWLVSRSKLDSVTAIAQYQGPLLQSHGNADRTIPIALAEKLFQAANQPKQWVTIDNAGHNNWITGEYLQQLDRFLDSLPAPPQKQDSK